MARVLPNETQGQQRPPSPTAQRTPGSASFRDPAGRLLLFDDRVVRFVNGPGATQLRNFLTTDIAQDFVASGRLVSTQFPDPQVDRIPIPQMEGELLLGSEEEPLVVEHERIALRSFPYEWPPQMLHAAGALMIDLAVSALTDGFSLKDATPYNVLFQGTRPIFVDLLSFERREPGDPTWLPCNQFVQTVLLPLLVNKYFGLRLDQLLTVHREGLEPADVARLCGPLRKLRPLFLSLVFLPNWLGANRSNGDQSLYDARRLSNPEQADFVLRQQFNRLRRQLAKVEPASNQSTWSDYMVGDKFFSAEYFQAKETFVTQVLEKVRPRRVLDVGCNTGHFSRLAAGSGASVVAIDQDPTVVGTVWKRASEEKLDILPLVVNLARPTPALGWRNAECPAFLDRVRGSFDLVLMLAVLHHILVTEQIPLPAVLELAAELTSQFLIVEFVAPEDPMFRTLVRGREELFRGLTNESFEVTLQRWFDLVRVQRLNETRWLYLLRKRGED
jgi:2-polyprenyl-3-methyl-5-hydroxy-6-metoxy-1,4-benzoquinol methylase